MGIVIAPIKPTALEAWKAWNKEIMSSKKEEFTEFNSRMNLTSHKVWLAQTPNGPMAVVQHKGPGETEFMQKLAASDHPFDQWFKNSISEFHGIDFSKPPPGPSPELLMDWKAE